MSVFDPVIEEKEQGTSSGKGKKGGKKEGRE